MPVVSDTIDIDQHTHLDLRALLLVLSVWCIPVIPELIIPTPLLFHLVFSGNFATIASLYRCALKGFRRYYVLQSRLRLLDLVVPPKHCSQPLTIQILFTNSTLYTFFCAYRHTVILIPPWSCFLRAGDIVEVKATLRFRPWNKSWIPGIGHAPQRASPGPAN
ncbi:hypothetical protein BJ165DRAFT_578719 [Panaeolus papilionaceus]|nr:hypothetical protein BJ165DRAFT_578719 [Panaeolus papilionaceus]